MDRDIWQLSWPLALGLSVMSAVQLIDIFMLGRLGTDTLAAVGYATQLFFVVQSGVISIGAACVAMMARALGAQKPLLARQGLAAAMALALGFTAGLAALALAFPRSLLALLDVRPAVVELSVPYLRLTLGSGVFFGVGMTLEHAFRAAKNTVVPMCIAALIGAVKLLLNWFLIFGTCGFPELGLVGAGIATLGSHFMGMVVFLAASRLHSSEALHLRWGDFRLGREAISQALRISLPAIAERLMMNLAILAYFRFLGQYGVAAVAAYNVGVRMLSFSWIPGLGLAAAASTLVGRALGAEDPQLAKRSGWRAAGLALLVSTLLGGFFASMSAPLAELFSDDPKVAAALDPFIVLLGIAQPFLGVHFALGGALRGAGDTVTPLKAATLGNWGFRVPVAYVFARMLNLDLVWVWSVMVMDHLARSAWLVWAFQKGRWQTDVGETVGASLLTENG